jgi:hypothetical protein
MPFPQIISGGQTGAERAALDWAVGNDIPCGGWCSKGRKTEEVKISKYYSLNETATGGFLERTKKNVIDADGTAVFTMAVGMGRRSRLTVKLAKRHIKPWLHIHNRTQQPALLLTSFIQGHRIRRLNVAGSRASEEPTIVHFVRDVLNQTASFLANGNP